MAKDDYFVFVYKILAYLYECLKGKKSLDFEYLQPLTKDFPIEESYFNYIMENIYQSGYIEGIIVVPILGQPHGNIKYTQALRITPKGIEYLLDNSMMSKARDFLKTLYAKKNYVDGYYDETLTEYRVFQLLKGSD